MQTKGYSIHLECIPVAAAACAATAAEASSTVGCPDMLGDVGFGELQVWDAKPDLTKLYGAEFVSIMFSITSDLKDVQNNLYE